MGATSLLRTDVLHTQAKQPSLLTLLTTAACLGIYLGLREPLLWPFSQGFPVYRLLVFILLGTEFCGSQNRALLNL